MPKSKNQSDKVYEKELKQKKQNKTATAIKKTEPKKPKKEKPIKSKIKRKRPRKKRTKEEQFIEKLNRRLREIKRDPSFGEKSEMYVDLIKQIKDVEGLELTPTGLISKNILKKENSKLILATLEGTIPTITDAIKETLSDEDIQDIIKASGSKYIGIEGKKALVNLRAAMKGAYSAAFQRFYNYKDQLAIDSLASRIADEFLARVKSMWVGEKLTRENVEKRRILMNRFVDMADTITKDTDEDEFLDKIFRRV
jgi:hypothetical protein